MTRKEEARLARQSIAQCERDIADAKQRACDLRLAAENQRNYALMERDLRSGDWKWNAARGYRQAYSLETQAREQDARAALFRSERAVERMVLARLARRVRPRPEWLQNHIDAEKAVTA